MTDAVPHPRRRCSGPVHLAADRQPRRDRAAHHAHAPGAWACASIAVYSDADADAPHVRLADQAVAHRCVGAARLLPEHRQPSSPPRAPAGAEAVHPGYGFLAENADFAQAVRRRRPGLGRPAGRGDPRHGRQGPGQTPDAGGRRALRAGLRRRPSRTTRRCARRPQRIGYPLMVKATAGGGGRGMRLVAGTPKPGGGAGQRPLRGLVGLRVGHACCSSAPSPSRAMSRSRSSPTRTAMSCTWANATARCSGGTRS